MRNKTIIGALGALLLSSAAVTFLVISGNDDLGSKGHPSKGSREEREPDTRGIAEGDGSSKKEKKKLARAILGKYAEQFVRRGKDRHGLEEIDRVDSDLVDLEDMEERKRKQLTINFFDKVMKEEEVNEKWSRDTLAGAIAELDRNGLSDTEIVIADCRETICKVVLENKDMDAYKYYDKIEFGEPFPWYHSDQVGWYENQKDGSVITTLYFSKEGEHETIKKYHRMMKTQ